MPGPSKKRLAPSDKRVQSEQPSKRRMDNERVQTPYYDEIDEDYKVFLSALIKSGNSGTEGSRGPPPFTGRTPKQRSQGERDDERVEAPYHDKIDEDYNIFLSGLTISGNSLVYDCKDGNQHRYDESADESRFDCDTEGSHRFSSSSSRMTPEQRSEGEWGEERVQTPYYDHVEESYYEFLSGLRISRNSLVYEGEDGKQFTYDDEFSDQRRSDSGTEGSHGPLPSIRRMTPEHRSEGEQGEERAQTPYHANVEELYHEFLSGLRISGDSLVYEGKDGKQFRYDDEFSDQSRSDSGTEGSNGPPPSIGRMTPGHFSEGERGEERVQTPYNDHVEEPYYEFLSGLRISGDSLVYEGKDDVKKKIRAMQCGDPHKALHLL